MTITNGSRSVLISQQGSRFSARLYVGLTDAVATLVCGQFKTLKGATRWAERQVQA